MSIFANDLQITSNISTKYFVTKRVNRHGLRMPWFDQLFGNQSKRSCDKICISYSNWNTIPIWSAYEITIEMLIIYKIYGRLHIWVHCVSECILRLIYCLVTWVPLHWLHNGRDSVSNHQPHDCLLHRSFRLRSKKTSKLRVTGLCAGNSPGPVNSPHKWPVTRRMFPFDGHHAFYSNALAEIIRHGLIITSILLCGM